MSEPFAVDNDTEAARLRLSVLQAELLSLRAENEERAVAFRAEIEERAVERAVATEMKASLGSALMGVVDRGPVGTNGAGRGG